MSLLAVFLLCAACASTPEPVPPLAPVVQVESDEVRSPEEIETEIWALINQMVAVLSTPPQSAEIPLSGSSSEYAAAQNWQTLRHREASLRGEWATATLARLRELLDLVQKLKAESAVHIAPPGSPYGGSPSPSDD